MPKHKRDCKGWNQMAIGSTALSTTKIRLERAGNQELTRLMYRNIYVTAWKLGKF
jgi:hypothetical protein